MTNTIRPTITLDHLTSRAYAADANSRILTDKAQRILKNAAGGAPVDLYDFNAALTEAMSSAATRCGQSTARRALTSKIRHLSYKTQAILENHADGLPVYEDGQRSRAVEALKAAVKSATIEIEHSTKVNQRLSVDLTTQRSENSLLKQAASDERRRLCAEIDDLKQALVNTQADVTALRGDRDEYADRLQYAVNLLDVVGQAQVKGFIDGRNS